MKRYQVKFKQTFLSWTYCKGNRFRSFKVKGMSQRDAIAKAKKIVAGQNLKYHSIKNLESIYE
jgi:hypothetical protein